MAGGALTSTAGAGVSHPHTPVEYFSKDEDTTCPPRRPGPISLGGTRTGRRGFTFHAHRLSRLWRTPEPAPLTLTRRYPGQGASPASSFQKYSHRNGPTGSTA